MNIETVTDGWISWRPLMQMAIAAAWPKREVANKSVFGAAVQHAIDADCQPALLELGAGDGSTAWLAEKWQGRILTLDSNAEWVDRFAHLRDYKHRIEHAPTWDLPEIDRPWGGRWRIALVDHAPGERRPAEIARLADICDLIVIHDTEPAARAGYGFDRIWHLFRYIKHDDRLNTWATIVSNRVDVTGWKL